MRRPAPSVGLRDAHGDDKLISATHRLPSKYADWPLQRQLNPQQAVSDG